MNLLGWVLCYTALFLNTGQCEKQVSTKHVKYEQSSEIVESRKAYGKSDQKNYEAYCMAKLPAGKQNCRDFTIEEMPSDDKEWQKVIQGYEGPEDCQSCQKKILDGLTEEERKIALLSQDEIQIKDEWSWPHKDSDAGPGCGFPVCALIDARPERFKSLCHLVHYIEDNKLTFRMFHIQKGDCYNTIKKKGHNWEWGKGSGSCSDLDKKWDIPFCLVDIHATRAHHFDNPCKAMKYLKHRKESVTLYIGFGNKDEKDQCKHLLKEDKVYLHTEWFDIDEPCITGDLESAAQSFHYVHNYPASESFRFCNKAYKDQEFLVQTVSYKNDGIDPKDTNQNTMEKSSNGGEFVCLNIAQDKKPQPPNYWFHRNIKCMDYRIQFRCKCFFGCKKKEKDFEADGQKWPGWNVRVPKIKTTQEGTKKKISKITKTLWDECEWRPSTSMMYPNKDTWDAEIRVHMTYGTKDAPGRKNFRGHACGTGIFDAMYVLAMRIKDGKPATETGEVITKYTPAYGFLCINKNQDKDSHCSNYAVKFCCKIKQFANWGEWSKWTECSKSCGRGESHRERKCQQDKPSETCWNFSHKKTAQNTQSKDCNIMPCEGEVIVEWKAWTQWGACSVTCGDGVKKRSRSCVTKSKDGERGPQFVQDKCPSKFQEFKRNARNNEFFETTDCNEGECEEPSWGDWSSWGECSATCDIGTKRRTRECFNIINMQKMDIEACKENAESLEYEIQNCVVKTNCPIDGGMGQWSPWSQCTVHCGDGGTRRRHRSCNDPLPQHGGKPCDENEKREEVEECSANEKCPVNCVWSKWGEWSECDKKCYKPFFNDKGEFQKDVKTDDIGFQRRKRHKAQEAEHGGRECDENANEDMKGCKAVKPCDKDCTWGEWGPLMGECEPCFDKNIDDPDDFKSNFQTQTRTVETQGTPRGKCINSKNKNIKHSQRMTTKDTVEKKCNPDGLLDPVCAVFYACWTDWSEWSECKGKCGKQGHRKQRRTCKLCPVGEELEGYESEEKRKELEKKECSKFIQKMEEKGVTTDCVTADCPNLCQHVGWGPWDPWGTCSQSCGKGTRVRARRCQGAGKDEIDYLIARKMCKGKGGEYQEGKLRQKQSEPCDMGACGSKDETKYY